MTDEATGPRLWEIEHPYYCETGNFYVSGLRRHEVHTSYDSWSSFYEVWGDNDPDYNLVFRWDWRRPDPADYEPDEELAPDTLLVFWVLQRRAVLRSTECIVTEDDEPAVRAWLTNRGQHLAAIWQPLDLTPAAKES